jgi:hypothetical protein
VFFQILQNEIKKGRIVGFGIWGCFRFKSGDVYSVIQLAAPANSHHYDLSKHGEKEMVCFAFKANKEIVVLIDISGAGKADGLIESFGEMDAKFSSN